MTSTHTVPARSQSADGDVTSFTPPSSSEVVRTVSRMLTHARALHAALVSVDTLSYSEGSVQLKFSKERNYFGELSSASHFFINGQEIRTISFVNRIWMNGEDAEQLWAALKVLASKVESDRFRVAPVEAPTSDETILIALRREGRIVIG